MKLLSLPIVPASLALAAFGVAHYPLNPFILGLILAGYAVILWFKPKSWLFFIPAILPVADLAPWSGWLYFEELDLFVLVTIAVGYLRLMGEKPLCRMPAPAAILLALLALSYGVSAWRGFVPVQPLDANAFASYLSHYNSLRLLKPFVWALLLLPLLSRSQGREEIEKLLVPGILTGLLLVCIVSFWERAAFPGLMNFSSDYRITASFPEMHTGGAALDAYLSMTLPFVLYTIFRSRKKLGIAAGMALLAFASYAVLVTFSRGLYLGYAASIAAMGVLAMLGGRGSLKRLPMVILLAVCALLLAKTFGAGGYRGLLAGSLLLGASFFIGGQGRRNYSMKGMLAVAALLFLASALLFLAFEKGAYLAFGFSLAFFAAGLFFHSFRNGRPGMTLAVSGFLAMILGDFLVNWHWGGRPALIDAALVSFVAAALAFGNRRIKSPLWVWNRETALTVSAGFVLMSLVVPVTGNYYMKGRFHDAESDMHVRTSHWQGTIEMMDRGWLTRAFGMGLGKFPETYYWRNRERGQPGAYLFGADKGLPYLRLSGSAPGWEGDFLRYGQRVAISPFRSYKAGFEIRNTFPKERLDIGICEKLLLYPMHCSETVLFPVPDGKWHRYAVALDSGAIGSEPWYRRPTAQFYFGNESRNGYLDMKDASLSDGYGNLVHNGDFRKGSDRWFFSSDHFHLPWHEKNLFLHVYFDQGFFGLSVFFLFFVYALTLLASRALAGDFLASALLASFLSLIMVGLFDSILDFPRLALLTYVLLFVAVLMPKAARESSG